MACETYGCRHLATNCLIVRAAHGPIEQLDFVGSSLQPIEQGNPTLTPTTLDGGITLFFMEQ